MKMNYQGAVPLPKEKKPKQQADEMPWDSTGTRRLTRDEVKAELIKGLESGKPVAHIAGEASKKAREQLLAALREGEQSGRAKTQSAKDTIREARKILQNLSPAQRKTLEKRIAK